MSDKIEVNVFDVSRETRLKLIKEELERALKGRVVFVNTVSNGEVEIISFSDTFYHIDIEVIIDALRKYRLIGWIAPTQDGDLKLRYRIH